MATSRNTSESKPTTVNGKNGKTKTYWIKEFFKRTESPKEVARLMVEMGPEWAVSAQYASTIKANEKRRQNRIVGKPGRPRTQEPDALIEMVRLVKQVGADEALALAKLAIKIVKTVE